MVQTLIIILAAIRHIRNNFNTTTKGIKLTVNRGVVEIDGYTTHNNYLIHLLCFNNKQELLFQDELPF